MVGQIWKTNESEVFTVERNDPVTQTDSINFFVFSRGTRQWIKANQSMPASEVTYELKAMPKMSQET